MIHWSFVIIHVFIYSFKLKQFFFDFPINWRYDKIKKMLNLSWFVIWWIFFCILKCSHKHLTQLSTEKPTSTKMNEQIETTNVVNNKIHCVFLTISDIQLNNIKKFCWALWFWYQHFDKSIEIWYFYEILLQYMNLTVLLSIVDCSLYNNL